MKPAVVLAATTLLAGCQVSPDVSSASQARQLRAAQLASPQWRGHKFAQDRCADCHAVEAGKNSPLPQAPSFTDIARRPDLTPSSLGTWLRNQHAHPDEMYFEIPAEHVNDLVSYIVSLRVGDLQSSPQDRTTK